MCLLGLQPLLDAAGRDAGGLVRDRRVQRIELVLHEELPVRVLHDAVADRHHLDLADRRAVAHVVEGDARFAEKLRQRRAFVAQAGEDEAAIAVDARRALHAAVGVVARHARALVALRPAESRARCRRGGSSRRGTSRRRRCRCCPSGCPPAARRGAGSGCRAPARCRRAWRTMIIGWRPIVTA